MYFETYEQLIAALADPTIEISPKKIKPSVFKTPPGYPSLLNMALETRHTDTALIEYLANNSDKPPEKLIFSNRQPNQHTTFDDWDHFCLALYAIKNNDLPFIAYLRKNTNWKLDHDIPFMQINKFDNPLQHYFDSNF